MIDDTRPIQLNNCQSETAEKELSVGSRPSTLHHDDGRKRIPSLLTGLGWDSFDPFVHIFFAVGLICHGLLCSVIPEFDGDG